MVLIKYHNKKKNVPYKYVPKTLSSSQLKKQIKSIILKTDRPKLDVKKRKSSWTVKFNNVYGDEIKKRGYKKDKKSISKVSGIPLKAIEEVYKKGQGAYYSGGSRPGQTSSSWSYARVYAYIMGGKKVREVDKHITNKFKVKFKI
jgi:hypothetical protein